MKINFNIYTTLFTVTLISVLSCSKQPKAIDYGNDGCHFCKMTIVDKIHASELITDKGKVYKFDATECMMDYLKDNPELDTFALLSNHFEKAGSFIKVEDATFLISKNLPSPMGANLTAFESLEKAKEIQSEKGGKLYKWTELKARLNK